MFLKSTFDISGININKVLFINEKTILKILLIKWWMRQHLNIKITILTIII